MATVYIGSARIDERGKATGGAAGDQTGKEVSKQAWYKHSKGWYVLRCKDVDKAAKIAECMAAACASKYIGYDQGQRLTLYNALKSLGFDIDRLAVKVETDCSALVRVCCAYAGITVGNFTTANEKAMLLATGEFVQLQGTKYEASSDYLRAGDILGTKTRGHTVVVITDGAKAEDLRFAEYTLGETILRNGCVGDDVRELQERLIALGYSCGDWGADGEFGDATEMAVMDFQRDKLLEVDGIAGEETIAALMKADTERAADNKYIEIRGGDCWMRDAPNKQGRKLRVLKNHTTGIRKMGLEDGWYHIAMVDGGEEGYMSAKYAIEVDGL